MSRRALIRIAVVALVLGSVALYFAVPESATFDVEAMKARGAHYDVEIIRDPAGVPHVYGKTDADVAYGLAYAQSEDDFSTVQSVMLAMRGRLATVKGPEAGPTDYLVGLFDVWGTVNRRYETDSSTAARALAEAYADGVNHYAALHEDEVLPGLVPLTGKDVVAGFVFKMPFFYGLDKTLRRLFAEPDATAFLAPEASAPQFGSNGFAVAPARSGDGVTRLVVNSHQPYVGPVAWYEARLHSETGLDIAGGTFPGAPVILHGHNRTLGWASTVNEPDLVDVYRLELHPDDPHRYRFDGAWRAFDVRTIEIRVKVFGRLYWTVEKEALTSVHGPVFVTPKGHFALRYAGRNDTRQLEQYYRMNRARTFDEWKSAMQMLALPSINFVYADREGHVGMFYNAQLPKRKEGVDWSGVLPGDDASLVWDTYLPFEAGPHVVDPPSGFVFSANHTPFSSTDGEGNPDPNAFSKTLGIQTNLTNRARRALELVRAAETVDRATLERIKYDKRYDPASDVVQEVNRICAMDLGTDELLASAKKALCSWDYSTEKTNTGAAIAITTVEPILRARHEGRLPPEASSLLLLNAKILERTHERIEVPWERVNRIVRGSTSAGLGGGPDTLRAVHGGGLLENGTRIAELGDTLVMFVEWGADGAVRSESIHQFGSASTRPRSKHFADQMKRFANEELKPMLFDETVVRKNAERTYRPGAE